MKLSKILYKSFFAMAIVSVLLTAVSLTVAFWFVIAENVMFNLESFIWFLPGILITILFVFAICMVMAKYFTHRIIKPIENMRQNPEENLYKELIPLAETISSQQKQIKKQFQRLQIEKDKIATLIDNMSEGFILIDLDKNVLMSNNSASKLLGSSSEKILYETLNEYSCNEVVSECVDSAISGESKSGDVTIKGKALQIIANPVYSNDRQNGVICLIIDISAKKKAEKMRREFTSNVSHELKTPLTTIYGVADMLANGMVKEADVAAFGGNIRREADRLITLINDIVALSKLDENSLPRSDEEIDLYELAAEIVGRLENCAAEKNITGTVFGDHVIMVGNRTVFDEVIYNLCDNAIKYGNIGGKYEVKLSHIPKRAILTVSDNGIGIPEEHIERIFERFYRVDKSRSRKIKGTGLGLSIVKHGVMYHGGTIRAVSTNEGTSFIAEFPLRENLSKT